LTAGASYEANDNHQLTAMLDQAQAKVEAVLGADAVLGAAVADAGYCSEANAASETETCELFIATRKERKLRAAATRAHAEDHDGACAHGAQAADQARPPPLSPAPAER
jgi:hypothetical protein